MNSKDLRSLRENNDKIILQINSEREAKQSLTYDIKIKEEQNRNLKVEISDLKIENNNYKDKSDLQIAELSKLNTQLEFITKQLSESKLEIDNLNIMAKKETSSDLDT
jgi:chromosome segregation ATPase